MEIKISQFRRCVQKLIKSEIKLSKDEILKEFLGLSNHTANDVIKVVNYLGWKLLESDYTDKIGVAFKQYILAIVSIAIRCDDLNVNDENFDLYQRKCIALAKLLPLSPDVKRYSLRFFENRPAPFTELEYICPRKKSKNDAFTNTTKSFAMVKCCYQLLRSDPEYFREIWDWSEFLSWGTEQHYNKPLYRLYYNHAVAILSDMSLPQLKTLNESIPSEVFLEFDREQSSMLLENECQNPVENSSNISVNISNDTVTNVEGVLLPIYDNDNRLFYDQTDGHYDAIVKVKSTQVNLQSIALGISSGKPVCLAGPVGCGKTTLVEYLARKVGRINPKETEVFNHEKVLSERQHKRDTDNKRKHMNSSKSQTLPHSLPNKPNGFLRIQLGDQTDGKMLLGQYCCTEIPGEFIWLPGVLTQSVINGYWLLLEDIDSATQDTFTILSSLFENNSLNVPGFRDCVKIAPGFQLFATVRTNRASSSSHKLLYSLLEKYLYRVNILPLSRKELCKVIGTNYPKLSTVSSRIVDVFLTFSKGDHTSADFLRNQEMDDGTYLETYVALPCEETSLKKIGPNADRLVSTRDLIKLCQRSNPSFSVTSAECAYFVFQNAVDVFCSHINHTKEKVCLITSIGAKLGIIQSRCEYFSNEYKPEIQVSREFIKVGRCELLTKFNKNESIELFTNKKKKMKLHNGSETINATNERTITMSGTFAFTRVASCILERIIVCVSCNEPVLLVGETGVGKTSAVQYLANRTHHKLVVVNMNNQSDVSDLIGGFKPVDFKFVVTPLRCEFEQLFRKTFNQNKNELFLTKFSTCYNQGNFSVLIKLMITVITSVMMKFRKKAIKDVEDFVRWKKLHAKLLKMDCQLSKLVNISFAFIAGPLVNCIQNGDWILLDEINLASAETLECLSTILEPEGSIVLLEKGEIAPVRRHPDFRIFACMNPSTDIGKKDLPVGIRNRFTEFFVDELTTDSDLTLLVNDYLKNTGIDTRRVTNIVKCYKKLKQMSILELNDGLGNRPVFSLRTLCRSLQICAKNLCGSIERNLYESFCISFLTQLDSNSHEIVLDLLRKTMLSNAKVVLSQEIPKPNENCINFEGYWIQKGPRELLECENYILTESVKSNLKDLARIISIGKLPILLQGPTSAGKTSLIEYIAKKSGNNCLRINNHEHTDLQEYIGTYISDESGKLSFKEGVLVQAMRNGFWIILDELNLASSDILEALNRVLDDNRELFIPETQNVVKAHKNFMLFATQNPPGLYGGRKTLSRAFKNRFIELHFSEIPRNELEIILEKRCLIPASYAKKMVKCMWELQKNRKTTSRSVFTLRDLFRWGNRYTFADKKLLNDQTYDWNQHLVEEGYLVLSAKVRTNIEIEIIEETLYANFRKRIDTNQLFGMHHQTGSAVTRDIIGQIQNFTKRNDIVWTHNVTRMAVLTAKALEFDEPVLLVGPTGCGKTTICQILASIRRTQLRILNCHMHTEGADFLGGLRPCRSADHEMNKSAKLFEWADGPLVISMQEGSYFLADEISLAEDSVLERLNCILEPERTLLLAEKGGIDSVEISKEFVIKAKTGFQFLATMNPGGDFGKKELSPALRNRFTEIWCIPSNSREDLTQIAKNNIQLCWKTRAVDRVQKIAKFIVDVVFFIQHSVEKFKFSIRDILAWTHYITTNDHLPFPEAFIFGLETIFLDALDMLPYESVTEIETAKRNIVHYAILESKKTLDLNFTEELINRKRGDKVEYIDHHFGIKPFYVETNNVFVKTNDTDYFFDAPTTKKNLFRLLSALTLKKPVLLEGAPGVGKTSIVENIAQAIGFNIVRINLCEHTDLADLFGTDLPTENSLDNNDSEDSTVIGSFEWRDGPLLAALKAQNTWILLDELNLAPQAVLEGLNAILDHRGEVYIPELNKTFQLNRETRIFACQNPLRQGGGRKGLPQSFLNRFTKVYLRKLSFDDLLFVINSKYSKFFGEIHSFFEFTFKSLSLCSQESNNLFKIFQFPDKIKAIPGSAMSIEFDLAPRMVRFSEILDKGITNLEFGCKGGPFEINLRDILRWCDLLIHSTTGFVLKHAKNQQISSVQRACDEFEIFQLTLYERMKVVYYQRMRSDEDKIFIRKAFAKAFDCDTEKLNSLSEDVSLYWTDSHIYLNDIVLSRESLTLSHSAIKNQDAGPILLPSQREILKNMIECVYMDKPILLCGPSDTGKTKLIDTLCTLANVECSTDTIDDSVTGSFQQIDFNRQLEEIVERVQTIYTRYIQNLILEGSTKDVKHLMKTWSEYVKLTKSRPNFTDLTEELTLFRNRINLLSSVIENLLSIQIDREEFRKSKNEIEKQQHNLVTLERTILNAESLNTGGSFEFVDSKIVKALKIGQHIKLEHVNLCSSAVLDRLNPVFEPHGTLLISEKGVSTNRTAEVVHRSENFRAFLTADPKNGELSRAMRNRCIEIALSKDSYNKDDLRMIIYKNGVHEIYLMEVLITIHNRIRATTEMNNFSISHLSHFSHLVRAYKNIGYTDEKAVYTSGMEVYVYSSNTDLIGFGLEFYQKKLREIVFEESRQISNNFGNFSYENVFLTCNNLTTISLIKLQVEPLRIFLQDSENQSTMLISLFSEFANLDLTIVNENSLKKYFIYMLYECSSFKDAHLRFEYLKYLLTNTDDLLQLNEMLFKRIEDFKLSLVGKIHSLPWNTKLFSRIRDYSENLNEGEDKELCLSLALFSELLLSKISLPKIKKRSLISAFAYSQAINDQLINDNLNNSLLRNLFQFIKTLYSVINATLCNCKLEIRSYAKIIPSFLWFNRFLKIAQEQLFVGKEVNTDLIDELVLHFKWLDKYLLKLFEDVSPNYRQLNSEFENCLQKIRSYEFKNNHPLNLIRKIYSKRMLNFHPFYSEHQISFFLMKTKLDEALSVVPIYGTYDFELLRKKFHCQKSEKTKNCKEILLKHTEMYDLHCTQMLGDDSNIPQNIRNVITEYLKIMTDDHESDDCSKNNDLKNLMQEINIIVDEINHQDEVEKSPYQLEIELLPIREYYVCKSLTTSLLTKTQHEPNFLFFKNIPSLSSDILELCQLIQSGQYEVFQKVWSAITEHITEMESASEFEDLLQYLSTNYCSLASYSRLLTNSVHMIQIFNLSAHSDIIYVMEGDEISSTTRYNGPPLTDSLIKLLFQSNGHLKSVPLKDLNLWKKSLCDIQQLLWNNSAMTMKEFNIFQNNYKWSLVTVKKLIFEIEFVQKICHNMENESFTNYSENSQNLINTLKAECVTISTYSQDVVDNPMAQRKIAFSIALINSLIGAIELCLFRYMPLIDPVKKNRLKNNYLSEDIDCLNTITTVYNIMKIVMKYKHFGDEIYSTFEEDLKSLVESKKKFTQKVALRPKKCLYSSLSQDINHFVNTNCDPKALISLIKIVHDHWNYLTTWQCSSNPDPLEKTTEVISKIDLWIMNSQRFKNHTLRKYSGHYEDFVRGISCCIDLIRFGFEGLRTSISQVRSGFIKDSAGKFVNINMTGILSDVLENIIEFPSMSNLKIFNTQLSRNDIFKTKSTIFSLLDRLKGREMECLRLLKVKITEILNQIAISLEISQETFLDIDNAFKIYNRIFQQEEEQKLQKKAEEDNLYKMKTKCESQDDQIIELEEIADIFPTNVREDFGEFIAEDTLEKITNRLDCKKDAGCKNVEIISTDDYAFLAKSFIALMKIHSKLHRTELDGLKLNLIDPFKDRLTVFIRLFSEYKFCLNENTDEKIYNALKFAVGLQQERLNEISFTDQPSSRYNFYKDSNIPEVISCTEVLSRIESRVQEQLSLYPEHATLNDIIEVIKRIRNLPSNAPVVRFSTGFQILRQKLVQWNEVAHKKNNLRNEEIVVAENIQKWTKLELHFWRNCLSQMLEKVESNAYRYWFFIYNLFQEFIQGNEVHQSLTDMKTIEKRFAKGETIDDPKDAGVKKVTTTDIIRILRQFIESSNYGDYDVRISLLRSFEIYLQNIKMNMELSDKEIDTLIVGIHNLLIYFSQFTAEIDNAKNAIRSPIEKKLREFVKIESYNKDLSYFSMKSSVSRVHRNLNKFLREYKEQLEQKIIPILQPKESIYKEINASNTDDNRKFRDSFLSMIDKNIFIATQSILTSLKINLADISNDRSLLSKVDKLFITSRDIVKKTITSTPFPIMLEAMDEFCSSQIETCNYLRNLEIDRSVDRQKQIIEAKQILQQKRKALSDWFKALAHLGLSYKTGLMEHSLRDEFEDLSIPAFFTQLSFQDDSIKQKTYALNNKINMYYARCIFKLKILQNAMLSPPSELGPPNIDRIKGFSIDAFLLVQEQRKMLANSSIVTSQLQECIDNIEQLTKINDEQDKGLDSQQYFCSINDEFVALKASICKIRLVVEQFLLFISCVPECDSLENRVFTDSRNVLLQGDEKFSFISTTSRKIVNVAKNLLLNLTEKRLEFVSQQAIFELRLEHKKLINQINELRDCFRLADSHDEYLPAAKPLTDLLSSAYELSGQNYAPSHNHKIRIENFDADVEDILHTMLLALQKLFKKYSMKEESAEKESEELQENHLRSKLFGEMSTDWNVLNISYVICKIRKLLEFIKYSTDIPFRDKCIRQFIQISAILKQYKLVADYYLCQQLDSHYISAKMLSIMLSVFAELSLKGFCTPNDLMQEEKKEHKQKEGENFGMEDGTGEKNVSDKIESEDQLDDAKRPEDREKEDKNDDCKEEMGIEMSEDFEGKLQDIDKPEDNEDEDENPEDDTDLDKEMGETEEGADKLDDQIWGDDEEQKENKEDENEMNGEEGKGSKDETDTHNDLDAKNDHQKGKDEHEKDGLDATNEQSSEGEKRQEQSKDLDKMDNPEIDDDQINPYHNELEEPPQPEEMILSDFNMNEDQLDEEDGEPEDDNPFDIDKMKDNLQVNGEEDQLEEQNTDNDKSNEENNSLADGSESESEVGEEAEENKANDDSRNEDLENENEELDSNTKPNVDEESPEIEEIPENENKSNDTAEEHKDSKDKPSNENNVQSVPETSNNCSADQVEKQEQDKNIQQDQNLDEQDTGEDKDGVGQAENETTDDGHQGISETKETLTKNDRKNERVTKEKRKQGRTNENRTLGETEEPKLKQLKTVEKLNEKENEEKQEEENTEHTESEEYQHVKNPKSTDKTTLDNATEEQSKNLQHLNDEEQKDDETSDAEQEIDIDETDEKNEDLQEVPEVTAEKVDKKSEKPSKTDRSEERADYVNELEIEGENIETLTVPRGDETSAHCNKEIVMDTHANMMEEANTLEALEMRKLYRNQIMPEAARLPKPENYEAWQVISNRMSENARELCEQLRLILEPTKCTRLKGDYRTGRRINMKKIIPYIASQFRKDKIWLRRTKPAKRDYKITIAIDDSKSMHHNNSKNLTLEAISLISQALTLLESGRLSILSFGESPKIILNHTEQFDGPKLMNSLNFSQNKTKIAELLNFIRIVNSEEACSGSDDGLFENLVLILSDGRNIFSEGKTNVKNAIKLARLQRIFLVYIIIDNPENKNSILDIQSMEMLPDKKFAIKPYLDEFPFPYYVIVRDLHQLPLVLSEAMRQWFELVNSE